MHISQSSILTILFTLLLSIVMAHPPNFSPNHALLPRACPPFDPAGVKNVGNGAGKQFIGGQCLGTADCASGCCAKPCGICSGPAVGNANGKTGCGFESSGNANANAGTNTASTAAPAVQPPAAATSASGQQCSG